VPKSLVGLCSRCIADLSHANTSIAGNYFMRYMFAAGGSAIVLPAIRGVGVGWFSTISALFLMAGAAATWVTAEYGKGWRDSIDEKKAARKEADIEG